MPVKKDIPNWLQFPHFDQHGMDHSISSKLHVLTNNAKENSDNNDTNDMTNKALTSNHKGQYDDIKDQTLALRNQLLFSQKTVFSFELLIQQSQE